MREYISQQKKAPVDSDEHNVGPNVKIKAKKKKKIKQGQSKNQTENTSMIGYQTQNRQTYVFVTKGIVTLSFAPRTESWRQKEILNDFNLIYERALP